MLAVMVMRASRNMAADMPSNAVRRQGKPIKNAARKLRTATGKRVADDHCTQSEHFAAGASPQGMIGTVDVEFFGLPSISLSE
jgi:hypothetical protein